MSVGEEWAHREIASTLYCLPSLSLSNTSHDGANDSRKVAVKGRARGSGKNPLIREWNYYLFSACRFWWEFSVNPVQVLCVHAWAHTPIECCCWAELLSEIGTRIGSNLDENMSKVSGVWRGARNCRYLLRLDMRNSLSRGEKPCEKQVAAV